MKSPLVATLLWLALCLSAQAQPQCPSTPATGTSNSMCASTAFVTKGITLGGLTIGQAVIAAGNGHGFLYDNAGVVGEIGAVVGGNVGFGTETNPQQPVVISRNVTTGVLGSATTPELRLIGPDGVNGAMELMAFTNSASAVGVVPNYFFAVSGGTAALPSGVKATQTLGQFGFRGMTSAPAYTASRANIMGVAAEDFTSTNQGTYINFVTTPIGAIVASASSFARLQSSGAFSIGTVADSGAGTTILNKQTFASLTTCSGTIEGAMASITDSTTATWGAAITGGSTNHVLGYCDGTNWTVAGK